VQSHPVNAGYAETKLTGIFVQFRMKIKKILPLHNARTAADVAAKMMASPDSESQLLSFPSVPPLPAI
jgi:hypothetical protein